MNKFYVFKTLAAFIVAISLFTVESFGQSCYSANFEALGTGGSATRSKIGDPGPYGYTHIYKNHSSCIISFSYTGSGPVSLQDGGQQIIYSEPGDDPTNDYANCNWNYFYTNFPATMYENGSSYATKDHYEHADPFYCYNYDTNHPWSFDSFYIDYYSCYVTNSQIGTNSSPVTYWSYVSGPNISSGWTNTWSDEYMFDQLKARVDGLATNRAIASAQDKQWTCIGVLTESRYISGSNAPSGPDYTDYVVSETIAPKYRVRIEGTEPGKEYSLTWLTVTTTNSVSTNPPPVIKLKEPITIQGKSGILYYPSEDGVEMEPVDWPKPGDTISIRYQLPIVIPKND